MTTTATKNPLQDQLDTVTAAAKRLIAKADGRALTDAEIADLGRKTDEAVALKAQIAAVAKSEKGLNDLLEFLKDDRQGDDDPYVSGYSATTGYLALSGKAGAEAGTKMAHQIKVQRGEKAITTTGQITTSIPLISASPIEEGRVPVSILDVLPVTVHAENPVWKYLRQTNLINNAAIVAPGEVKPTSQIGVETVDGSLQVFAHLSDDVDRFVLLDSPSLASFISGQLLWGIREKLQAEVLDGDGTSGHLLGLANTPGVQHQAPGLDPIVTLRASVTKLEALGFSASAFLLNDEDWAEIESARTTSGSFDLGPAVDRAARKVWGVQVITTPAIARGTAFALDTSSVGIDADAGVRVDWDASSGERFERNLLRARVEGRFGLSVYRPAGVVVIDLDGSDDAS
jgi:hypothetical protein